MIIGTGKVNLVKNCVNPFPTQCHRVFVPDLSAAVVGSCGQPVFQSTGDEAALGPEGFEFGQKETSSVEWSRIDSHFTSVLSPMPEPADNQVPHHQQIGTETQVVQDPLAHRCKYLLGKPSFTSRLELGAKLERVLLHRRRCGQNDSLHRDSHEEPKEYELAHRRIQL